MKDNNKEQIILQEQEDFSRPDEDLIVIDAEERTITEEEKIKIQSIMHELEEISIPKVDIYENVINGFRDNFKYWGNSIINMSNLFTPITPKIQELAVEMSKTTSIFMHNISEVFASLADTLNKVALCDDLTKRLYKIAFEEHKEVINMFYNNYIFPPINYIIDNEIYELDENIDIEKFILSEEINSYYVKRIEFWKDKFKDESSKRLISDIAFNLEHSKDYAVAMLTFSLIERLLNLSTLGEYRQGNKGALYPAVRAMLKEEVFKPVEINELFIRFIQENLYANTDKATHYSRHTMHGVKIELLNMTNAMSVIFIYDFIQELIELKENENAICILN